jgi:hypothetical protein
MLEFLVSTVGPAKQRLMFRNGGIHIARSALEETLKSSGKTLDSLAQNGFTDCRRDCLLEISEHGCNSCTDLNFLCYNSFTGQGQLLWVGVCL